MEAQRQESLLSLLYLRIFGLRRQGTLTSACSREHRCRKSRHYRAPYTSVSKELFSQQSPRCILDAVGNKMRVDKYLYHVKIDYVDYPICRYMATQGESSTWNLPLMKSAGSITTGTSLDSLCFASTRQRSRNHRAFEERSCPLARQVCLKQRHHSVRKYYLVLARMFKLHPDTHATVEGIRGGCVVLIHETIDEELTRAVWSRLRGALVPPEVGIESECGPRAG